MTAAEDAEPPVAGRSLAILAVYFLRTDDDIPLLQLHLDRIRRHTTVPYTIYAVANRLSDAARSVLAAASEVVICDVAPTSMRSSREHGYYLDALLDVALAHGATHVATFDVDSFPVADGWFDTFVAAAPESSGLAGVLRAENGDTELPHPSCIVARADFFTRLHPTFAPFPDTDRGLRAFQASTGQAADTGVDLAVQVWRAQESWGKVLRSNAVDPHHIMAGIYGDVVFHLGGIGHGKIFRHDIANSRAHRWSRPLERIPGRIPAVKSAKKALLRKVRSRSEHRMAERNRGVYRELRDWLLSDPDGLIAYLRGQERPESHHRVAALSAASQLSRQGAP